MNPFAPIVEIAPPRLLCSCGVAKLLELEGVLLLFSGQQSLYDKRAWITLTGEIYLILIINEIVDQLPILTITILKFYESIFRG